MICKTLRIVSHVASFISRDELVKTLVDFANDLKKLGGNIIHWITEMSKKYEGKLEKAVMDLWEKVERYINGVWRENLAWVSTTFDLVEEMVDTFVDSIEGRIDEIEQKLLAVGMIRKMIQLYKDYATWIEEIPIHDYVENVENILTVR
jgi:hypothetical protein